jgi:hypothetical protein
MIQAPAPHHVWMAGTAYGDGVYEDRQGRSYGVDSGTIGLMPVVLCSPRGLARTTLDELGHVITFPQGCEPRCDNGLFRIGHLTIDTRGTEEEESA